MQAVDQLARMSADELRGFAASLIDKVSRLDGENRLKQLKIDQLTHEMAVLRRWKCAASSEQLQGEQKALFDETLDADIEALGLEFEALRSRTEKAPPKEPPKRSPLPAHLPRREVRHEPDSTTCGCGCATAASASRPCGPTRPASASPRCASGCRRATAPRPP